MEYPVTLDGRYFVVHGREREASMKKTRKAQAIADAAHRLKAQQKQVALAGNG